MKTIFMTMSRGFLARNILQTDVYAGLLAKGHRIVIATPAWNDPEFTKEFGHPNVEFVPMSMPGWTKGDQFFGGLHHNLVWNRTIEFTAKYGVYDPNEVKPWRYWLQILFWRPLAAITPLRRIARFFDALLCPPSDIIVEQLKNAAPSVVFLTNPMEFWDSYYIKAAKKLGIPTVALVKSWDNMSKMNFRIITDYALVWGPYMTDEAIRYQLYPRNRVFEVGAPQFDIYVNREGLVSGDAFLSSLHLDPSRKTILFGSEGKVTPGDPDIVAGIADMIRRDAFSVSAQILVRPHFGYKNDAGKFDALAETPHVVVDRVNTPRPAFYDQWDYSKANYHRLAETFFASDVCITTASTLAIDAAACGLPCIVVAFDGHKVLPHRESVARWYETEYYSNVLETGAITVTHNFAELQAAITAALSVPEERQAARERLLARFVGRLDGHSGERIADFLSVVATTGRPPSSV